jgi:predicted DNA-binding antitoxin AbrB/MazE fold protein
MPIVVEATYENGVLKLDKPLPLDEHARVRLTVNPVGAHVVDPFEDVIGIGDGAPDGANRHDDHIYGERRMGS